MNIFWLDNDPYKCAEYHCDTHVVKMIVEYCQLLSTTVRLSIGREVQVGKRILWLLPRERHDGSKIIRPRAYGLTHHNHPCAVWTRESRQNYDHLKTLALALCDEYTRRYDRRHKTQSVIECLPKPKLPSLGLTRPALAMPDDYKSRSPVQSYRTLYQYGKRNIAHWRHGPTPKWFSV